MVMWPGRCSTPVSAPGTGPRAGCRAPGWSARSIPFGTGRLRAKRIGLRRGSECRWRRMILARRILLLAWFATLALTRCWLDRCRVPASSTSERRFTIPTCPVRRCVRHSVYRRSEPPRSQLWRVVGHVKAAPNFPPRRSFRESSAPPFHRRCTHAAKLCRPKLASSNRRRTFQRATESFRPPPFQRAVRPAPAASRLQLAPPVGLLAWVGKCVQNFSVFLNELDARQIRPRRRRNVLSGRLTPQYLPQPLVEPPVVALTKQARVLRVLTDRQLRAAAAAADRVCGEFAPGRPCFRHGSRAGHALFDFNRLFARIAHQKSPQALNTRKLLQRK